EVPGRATFPETIISTPLIIKRRARREGCLVVRLPLRLAPGRRREEGLARRRAAGRALAAECPGSRRPRAAGGLAKRSPAPRGPGRVPHRWGPPDARRRDPPPRRQRRHPGDNLSQGPRTLSPCAPPPPGDP